MGLCCFAECKFTWCGLRNSAVRLSPAAFDPPATSATLVFKQTFLQQSRNHPVPIHLELTLKPGANELRLETDDPAQPASKEDPRKLAFSLVDWKLTDTD